MNDFFRLTPLDRDSRLETVEATRLGLTQDTFQLRM
jgi:hypothetical protein